MHVGVSRSLARSGYPAIKPKRGARTRGIGWRKKGGATESIENNYRRSDILPTRSGENFRRSVQQRWCNTPAKTRRHNRRSPETRFLPRRPALFAILRLTILLHAVGSGADDKGESICCLSTRWFPRFKRCILLAARLDAAACGTCRQNAWPLHDVYVH